MPTLWCKVYYWYYAHILVCIGFRNLLANAIPKIFGLCCMIGPSSLKWVLDLTHSSDRISGERFKKIKSVLKFFLAREAPAGSKRKVFSSLECIWDRDKEYNHRSLLFGVLNHWAKLSTQYGFSADWKLNKAAVHYHKSKEPRRRWRAVSVFEAGSDEGPDDNCQ